MSGDATMLGNKKVMIKLKSSDNEIFEVDALVASESQMLKDIIEDIGTETIVPVSEVKGKTLAVIIEYCKYQVGLRKSSEEKPTVPEDERKNWETEFIEVHGLKAPVNIIDLVGGAKNLNLNHLLHFACQLAVDNILGKNPEEIKSYFRIKMDFTREEEEEINGRRNDL